jgi:head-tail adaptor
VKAGRLRHRVTFERLLVELDSDGAQVETWLPAFDVSSRMPADVETLKGREQQAAAAVHSRVTSKITTRYRPGFRPSMRAWITDPATDPDAVVYNIEAVIPDPDTRRVSVTLLCSSGLSEGQ